MLKRIKSWPVMSWHLLGLLVLSGFILWPLFLPGYFFHHDDLQVMRVFEMRKCFDTWQIPCRWVPDMGYGNGYPLFNYYSVLPYYIGAVFSYIGGFVWAAKVLFFIPLLLGGYGMYFLVRKLYGDWPGFTAAVLFQFAPYRALDGYVRGDVAEMFALSIIPFVFYYFLKFIQKNSWGNFLGSVVSLGLFLMCHNLMTMFFVPILLVWVVVLWLREKGKGGRIKTLSQIVGALGLGVGLSAFFLLPVLFEKDLVRIDSLITGGSDFRAHFVTLYQMFFDRMWGYGASVFGSGDTISFQIGWPHWWIVVGCLGILGYLGIIKRKIDWLAVLMVIIFCGSIFMMHNKSTPIWLAIKSLQFAQFPWRFLTISIFTSSILGGYLIFNFPKKFQILVTCILVLVTFFLNWQFFVPKDFYPWINDQQKLSDPLWEIQQKAGILDYLPKAAYYEPEARAPYYPEIRQGVATSSGYTVGTDTFSFKANVTTTGTYEIPIIEFPNWKVFVDGKEYPHTDKNHWGRLQIELPPGNYNVTGALYSTPIRIMGNIVSLAVLGLLVVLGFRPKIRKRVFLDG